MNRLIPLVILATCCLASIAPMAVNAQMTAPATLPDSDPAPLGNAGTAAPADSSKSVLPAPFSNVGALLPQHRDASDDVLQRLERVAAEFKQRDAERAARVGTAPAGGQPTTNPAVAPAGFNTDLNASDSTTGSLPAGSEAGPGAPCRGVDSFCNSGPEHFCWNKGCWRIVPFGQLRGEVIYAQDDHVADAVIFFLAPNTLGADDQFTIHGKTSMLNFAVSGPNIGAWRTGGAFVMNLLGSQPLRDNAGIHVLNAFGEISDGVWRFAFGRMNDLFSPIAPNTVNMGLQRGAGNVGVYRGAVHVDRFLHVNNEVLWTLSGRLSQPVVNDYLLLPTVRGTDNGLPNFEGRAGLGLGRACDGVRPLEVGVSLLWGEVRALDPSRFREDGEDRTPPVIAPPVGVVSKTAGGAIDVQYHGQRAGFRGEFWIAEAAGTYFVGALQTLNPQTGRGIHSAGGWGEVYYELDSCTTLHLGYGFDNPHDRDVGFISTSPNDPGQRTLNRVVWANALWDVTDFFQLGLEVSHRKTDYRNSRANDSGMLYHFSSALIY